MIREKEFSEWRQFFVELRADVRASRNAIARSELERVSMELECVERHELGRVLRMWSQRAARRALKHADAREGGPLRGLERGRDGLGEPAWSAFVELADSGRGRVREPLARKLRNAFAQWTAARDQLTAVCLPRSEPTRTGFAPFVRLLLQGNPGRVADRTARAARLFDPGQESELALALASVARGSPRSAATRFDHLARCASSQRVRKLARQAATLSALTPSQAR